MSHREREGYTLKNLNIISRLYVHSISSQSHEEIDVLNLLFGFQQLNLFDKGSDLVLQFSHLIS